MQFLLNHALFAAALSYRPLHDANAVSGPELDRRWNAGRPRCGVQKKIQRKGCNQSLHRISVAAVTVFEADDVVLAEIGAGLDLDHLERHLARILEAVPRAERNEGGLVLRDEERLVSARHFRRTSHHHPMLGAMVVHLQRERRPRIDDDALDLKAAPGV